MIANNIIHDSKLRAMPVSVRWLWIVLLVTCGDHGSDTVEMTEKQLRDQLETSWSIVRVLDSLQSFQLLTYEIVELSLNNKGIKGRKEGRASEVVDLKKSVLNKKQNSQQTTEPEKLNENFEIKSEPSKPTAQDLFDLWNRVRGPLPKAIALSQDRITNAKKRLAENPDLEYWKTVIEKMAASKFCTGKNDSGWRADFDFLLKKDSHLKVLENKYSWEPPKQEQQISTLHRI